MDRIRCEISCCICSIRFFISKSPNLAQTDCIPYYLKCGHSACERCIDKSIRNRINSICNICNYKFDVTSKETASIRTCKSFMSIFPPNLYHIGALYFNSFIGDVNTPNRNSAVKFKSTSTIKKETFISNCCDECPSKATNSCLQCDLKLCDGCFSKIHSFISLKNHTKAPLGENNRSKKSSETCNLHKNNAFQYYCCTCTEYLCGDCIISPEVECKNHNVISIEQKNIELLKKLHSMKPQLSEILNNVMKVKFNVSLEIENLMNDKMESEYDLLQNKVGHYFGKAHAAIQHEELNKLKALHEHKNRIHLDLKTILDKVTTYKDNIDTILERLNMEDAQLHSGIRVTVLYRDVEEALNTPCTLAKGNYDSAMSCEVDDSFFKAVKKYCIIVSKPIIESKLLPISKTMTIQEINSQISINESTESEKEKLIANTKVKKSIIPSLFVGSLEKVFFAHLVNPGEFYVRRSGHLPIMEEMTASFRDDPPEFCDPKDIIPGNNYLSYDEKVGDWYRVSVIDSLGCEENGRESELHTVKYLDFGHRANVSASTLGMIPNKYSTVPPLLLRCSLPCNPTDCNWTEANSMMMQRILSGHKYCHILVRKIRNNSVEAELFTIPLNPFDALVSVKEALVFLEHAKYDSANEVNHHQNPLKVEQHYFKKLQNDVLKDSDEILITYILAPNYISIRKVELEGQMSDIQSCLNGKLNIENEEGAIYNPKLGMCVACYIEKYGWCRAKIEYVGNLNKIVVNLVDYGNSDTVTWSKLRKLDEKCFDYSELAIKCKLSGITEVVKRKESKALGLLKDCSKSWVPSTVQTVKHNGSLFEIVLMSTINDGSINVNDEFVKRGFSTALLKTTKIEKSVKISEPVNPDKIVDSKIGKNRSTGADGERKNEYLDATKGIEMKNSPMTHKNTYMQQPMKYQASNEEPQPETKSFANRENDSKLYVKILSTENPSHIYITFISQEKELAKMKKKLNTYYEKYHCRNEMAWNEGDKCAMFYSLDKSWYRGLIVSINESKLFTVFLKDIAKLVKAQVDELQPLAENFLSIRDGAIKCHMADIIPALGNNWPNITCEFLQDIIMNSNKFYIIKDGKIENKSMPIKLWILYAEETDPLEPIIEKWKLVNEMIVYKGLAVWVKDDSKTKVNENILQADEQSKLEEISNVQIQEPIILENEIKKTITHWLPAKLPLERNFTGIPTFVDQDFNIYVHVPRFHGLVTNVDRMLEEKFRNSSPSSGDMFWFEGQPCIAQWSTDSNFYRGTIEKIKENGLLSVLFVDYGNVEDCHVSSLRKNVIADDIPIQILKFKLHGIIPKNENVWDPNILDYIHINIVEKSCSIMVLGRDKNDVIYVNIKRNEDDTDVIDLLMKKNYARMGGFPMLDTVPGLDELSIDEYHEISDNSDILIDEEYET